jgi:hypothetical protein
MDGICHPGAKIEVERRTAFCVLPFWCHAVNKEHRVIRVDQEVEEWRRSRRCFTTIAVHDGLWSSSSFCPSLYGQFLSNSPGTLLTKSDKKRLIVFLDQGSGRSTNAVCLPFSAAFFC